MTSRSRSSVPIGPNAFHHSFKTPSPASSSDGPSHGTTVSRVREFLGVRTPVRTWVVAASHSNGPISGSPASLVFFFLLHSSSQLLRFPGSPFGTPRALIGQQATQSHPNSSLLGLRFAGKGSSV